MSNYTKTTDFAAKDSLPTGDAGKIIRGAEFGTEFDNIATAIATKADTAGPTLTGTTTFDTLSDGTIGVTAFVDEDDMSSDSATMLPTQQSVKAYVDSQTTAQDLDFEADTGGPLSIDLDSETLTLTGGTGVDTSGAGNAVTFAIDSTVATLTDTQTLTNKTLTSADIDTPDIDGGTIDGTVIGGTTAAAVSATTVSATGNITVDGTVDGRDVATDGTKLDTVETNADVTDTTNVTAAGALMDSEVANLAQVKAFDSADYATAAQGTTADNALPKTGGAMTGAITTNSTFDGRDVATDGTKLDGIEALADVTDTTNVTAAGALMDSELTDLTAVKSLDQGVATTDSPTFAGLTTTADVSFGDNDKAIFGAGSDLEIYHDGSNSFIRDAGTGNLVIRGTSLNLQKDGGESYITMVADGAVTAYYDNSAKLATSSTGIDVTGTVSADGLTVQGASDSTVLVEATGGNDASLFLTEAGTGNVGAQFVYDGGVNELFLKVGNNTDTTRLSVSRDTGDISFYEDTGTTAKLFWDASAESLGIGTAPDAATVLHVQATEPQVLISDASNPLQRFMAFDVGLAADEDTHFITVDQADALAFGEKLNGNDRVIENEWMRITNAGNVGIGTSSPTAAKMHVETSSGSNSLKVGTAAQGVFIKATGTLIDYNASGNSAGEHAFSTGNTERMRIDSSGQVGIGTDSPQNLLHVQDSTGSPQIRIDNQGTASGIASLLFRSGGAGNPSSIIQSGGTSSGNQGIVFKHGDFGAEVERMRIDSSGNVKVNDGYLEVNTETAAAAVVRVDYNATDSIRRIHALETGGGNARPLQIHAQDVRFRDDTAEAMRIDSSGNLLVGKTSADNTSQGVTIYGSTAPGAASFVRDAGNTLVLNRLNNDGEILAFRKDNTTVGSIGAKAGDVYLETGDTGIRMYDQSDAIIPVGSSGISRDAAINLGISFVRFKDLYLSNAVHATHINLEDAGGTHRTALDFDASSNLKVSTGASAGSRAITFFTENTEQMRLDSSGNLLVGRTTTINFPTNTTSGIRLGANRFDMAADSLCRLTQLNNASGEFDRFYIGSSIIGSITGSGSTTSYNTSSDQRLKDNIVDAPSASDDIDAIQVRSFDWKADGSHQKYGMVAQELNTVAPEAVSEGATEEDMMGVDYSKLVPMMLKEIQSLRARVAQLEGAN